MPTCRKEKAPAPHSRTQLACMERRRRWHPTLVLLPGESRGRRSLEACGPWGRWESDMTERLRFPFSLSCIGEGNGNPLQCSCLENPRDGGAWWAAVYGVTQNRTRLKWLSSSSTYEECHRDAASRVNMWEAPGLPRSIMPNPFILTCLPAKRFSLLSLQLKLAFFWLMSYNRTPFGGFWERFFFSFPLKGNRFTCSLPGLHVFPAFGQVMWGHAWSSGTSWDHCFNPDIICILNQYWDCIYPDLT